MKSYCHHLKLIVFCCLATLVFQSASAENAKLDSLKNVLLHTVKEDTAKANLLISFCNQLLKEPDYKSTLKVYSAQLLKLSTRLNFKKGIAMALIFDSMSAAPNADLIKEIKELGDALKLMEEINDKAGIGLCYQELGRLLRLKSNYKEAVENYLLSAKIREEIHDANGASSCYIKIGGTYQRSGDYEKALQYYFKALRMAESAHNRNRTCEAYICIGIVSFEQRKPKETISFMNKALEAGGDSISKINLCYIYNNIAIGYSNLKDLKKGLEYQFKALNAEKELGDEIGMAMSYGNIGSIYLEQKKIIPALNSYLKAVALSEKTNDQNGLCYFYNGVGSSYQAYKNYLGANTYFQKALKTSKAIDFKMGIRDAYLGLSQLSEEQKKFKDALAYHRLYSDIKDSILNEESLKQSNELNVRYETEKKEKEILLLTKDQELTDKTLKEQRLVRIGLISGLGLLFALSFLLYNRYRLKQKANFILEKQKAEIHQKNTLITDSIDYAKTIQEAILPDHEKLSECLSDYFILYKPKAIVSDDFYWTGRKGNETICVVADCTGHGVPGAFMSLLGHNMLENVIQRETSTNPGAILSALNKEITARFSKGEESAKHGMDIAVISINKETQQLQYAGARNSIYIVRKQALTEIKADKFSTGVVLKDQSTPNYTNQVISLEKDDMIYLFSDGYPDQKGGAEKKKFYYQPFKDLLTTIQTLSLDEQQKRLDDVIMNWIGKGEQIDDILVMGIRNV